MKKSFDLQNLLFVLALAAGLMVSCKDKETTVVETNTEIDTTAMPAGIPEETTPPADTTITGEPAGAAATPAK